MMTRAMTTRAMTTNATVATAMGMLSYAENAWRRGSREEARGVLEHGDDTLARCATTGREDDGDDASMDARSRVCSAWGHLTRERGDVRGADEALATARARARSVEDCASANAMWATHAARRKPS